MKRAIGAVLGVLALICSSPSAFAVPTDIRILYLNDFHGFVEGYKPDGSDQRLGGIAVLAGRVLALRRQKPSLLLAAGDMIQGDAFANLTQGESVIELMNAMKFDVMTLGNHEFDFGQEALKKRISEMEFPLLGANVEGIGGVLPYVVKEVGGVKVAVIGVVTEEAPVSTHPANVVGLSFSSPQKAVADVLSDARSEADIVVVLSHIGHPADRELAEGVPGIDVIVGGHSHTKVDKVALVGRTIVVQAWEHGKTLGVLDLTVDRGRVVKVDGRLEEIRPGVAAPDAAVAAIVEKYKGMVDSVLNGAIGVAEVDLDGENVRKRETNLGNLVTDVVRRTAGADVAILNGGDIRMGIRKGVVQVKHLYAALPFGDYVVAVRLSGGQIREALEHGVSALAEGGGRFPQVSGLSFRYAPSAPPGKRVGEILVGEQPLEEDKEYVVATNDFLAAGGDGYKVFGAGKVVYNDSSRLLRDLVIESIRSAGKIAPAVAGRISEKGP